MLWHGHKQLGKYQ